MNESNNDVRLPRMRTIPRAYDEIKKLDPNTSISMRAFRKLIGSGQIPTKKVGNKVLIDLNLLFNWLSCYNDIATGA